MASTGSDISAIWPIVLANLITLSERDSENKIDMCSQWMRKKILDGREREVQCNHNNDTKLRNKSHTEVKNALTYTNWTQLRFILLLNECAWWMHRVAWVCGWGDKKLFKMPPNFNENYSKSGAIKYVVPL